MRLIRLPLFLLMLLLCGGCPDDGVHYRLGGGPSGGTFRPVAVGLAEIINEGLPQVRVRALPSGGSQANLVDVESGRLDMGLVYATDLVQSLESPGAKGEELTVLARLYGASAHLAVRQGSVITSPYELRRRRVAVGGPGSGAARSAERFFRAIGVWPEMIPIYSGYGQGMDDLRKGWVDAVWEMVGVPSQSLAAVAGDSGMRLLDLGDALEKSAFLQDQPDYVAAVIEAGSYGGQRDPVRTFEDSALWVARRQVDPQLAYRMLEVVFTPPGFDRMRRVHPVTGALDASNAVPRAGLPLHPGAVRFWQGETGR